MNKRQLEVEKVKLAAEAKELKELKAIYQKAADDISKKIRISDGKINVLLQNFDDLDDKQKSILQSQIYQRKFQQSLRQQIDDFTNALVAGQYKSIDDYMRNCYEVGFLGAMYDLHGQGIPLIMPIDEKQVVKAMYTNSKISKRLYTKLGEDVDALKKRIASSLSRGIATADSYANIARNIASDSNVGFNRAMRISRTEGHRIQANSAYDAQLAAKAAGADIVKLWDSTLDGKTRTTHRQLDGQIRELEEPFEIGGMEAMYPSGFGRASEDVNCRCALLQRAKWALDDGEFTKMNNFTKELETFDSPKSYAEFKKGFFSDGNVKYMNYVQQMEKKYKIKDFAKVLSSMTEREYKHYSKLLAKNPVFNIGVIQDNVSKAIVVETVEQLQKYSEDLLKKHGIVVDVADAGKYIDEAKANIEHLEKLLSEYDSTCVGFKIVTGGLTEGGSAYMLNGRTSIQVSRKTLRINKAADDLGLGANQHLKTTYHEFSHSLSQSREKTDSEFWKELRKIKRDYSKERNGANWFDVKISDYADKDIDEFLAEAFAQAKLSNNPSTYAIKVLETVDKYFKKTTKASKGLGAKIGGEGLIALHEEPALLKKIDYSKKKVIQNELKDFEKDAIKESIETACVITTNGEVYKCYGIEDRVFPDYDLGDKLKGASVSHNHPIDETVFSFSKDDMQLFVNYDLDVLRGCDEKYTYVLTRNPADIDEPMEDWMNFENYYHVEAIRLAKEYGIGYRRWKNE